MKPGEYLPGESTRTEYRVFMETLSGELRTWDRTRDPAHIADIITDGKQSTANAVRWGVQRVQVTEVQNPIDWNY